MITYSHPETFCRIVCEKIAERGERIRATRWGLTGVKLALTSGVAVDGSNPRDSLLKLCQRIAALPHWGITGIAYQEPKAEEREAKRKAKFKTRSPADIFTDGFNAPENGPTPFSVPPINKEKNFNFNGEMPFTFDETEFEKMFKTHFGGKMNGFWHV